MRQVEFRDDSVTGAPVRGLLHRSERSNADGLVLTHGAGANCRSALLTAVAEAFCKAGVTVLRCDLPFRQSRPVGPPSRGSAERDQAGLRAAAAALRRETSGRIYLGGHSYGGRQASMLAAQNPQLADALLLLSYPLHPPEKPAQMRTGHFSTLLTPAFFASGGKDGFGTREEFETALRLVPAATKLMIVPGVGHELMGKKTEAEFPGLLVDSFLRFTAL